VTNLLELQLFVEFKRSFENLATKKAWQLEKIRQKKKMKKIHPPGFWGTGGEQVFFKIKL
jgi:hypothetical protein